MNRIVGIAVGLACLGAVASARAESPPSSELAQSARAAVVASGAGGLLYLMPGEEVVDGLLAEIQGDPAMREALRYDTEGLVEEASPAGGTMVDLRGRFQSVVVARLDPSGRVHLEHVTTPDAAAAPDTEGPVCSEAAPEIEEVVP